jgi:hypothetical protein
MMPPRAVSRTATSTVGSFRTSCRYRPGVVALNDLLVTDVCAVSGGKADRSAAALKDVSDQARRGRFAVRSGDSKDRNAAFGSRREKHVEHVLGDVAPDAFARRKMHPKPGAALTSMIPPPSRRSGSLTFGAMISTPATSRPMMRAMRSKRNTFSGWTSSVRSIAVPPVEIFAVVLSRSRSPSGKNAVELVPRRDARIV